MSTSVKADSARSRHRRIWATALFAVGAMLFAGLLAPFVSADRLGTHIQYALENSLGRKVTFRAVHLTLFSGPGFSLENVTIGEDRRYGIEPFAFVPTLQARVRLDKLLFGYMRFLSLRLVDPSLNLVQQSDGTWNVVELVSRLAAPRRAPLNLFPSFEVSGARINFKLGARKTTLYMLDSDLAIYPERSGKFYFQLSGSPARTDRAGNGFGHFRGAGNWYVNPSNPRADQLEADLTLDPSNLSELATLVQGHDIGVHGTVGGRAHIDGPSTALRIAGELRLTDVHRWDLLPSSGEAWRVRYKGGLDLSAATFSLETLPLHPGDPTPVALGLHVSDLLTGPVWSLSAQLMKAPVQSLLPLARRMGVSLPQNLTAAGSVDGAFKFSNHDGLAGNLTLRDILASVPGAPSLGAELVNVTLIGDRVHFDPVALQTPPGVLRVSGDYMPGAPSLVASLETQDFPIKSLKTSVDAWLGGAAGLDVFADGLITGQASYRYVASTPSWSGHFQFSDALLSPAGLAVPLLHSQGRVAFTDTALSLSHFSATLTHLPISGSYYYSSASTKPAHLHLELPAADLSEIETALSPTLQAQGLLARLRFTGRAVPDWLAARNLEGELSIGRFSVAQNRLGSLSSHFLWQGTDLQLSSVQVRLPQGLILGRGALELASYSPRYRFAGEVKGFPWLNGSLDASGNFETAGTGTDLVRHLRATGVFSGQNLSLTNADVFEMLSGAFVFSFADGWPDLRLSKLQAEDDGVWSGEAASQRDGKLIFNLESAGRSRQVTALLIPQDAPVSSPSPNPALFQ